jgi:hypothetical protein
MIAPKNPELLRYMRSELRPSRVAMTTLGTVGIALLLALFIFVNSKQSDFEWQDYWRNTYSAIFLASSIVLVLWSLLNASQAIVSERTQRTFDFWRTTRLSPMTLALGKLFGAPLLPWLQYVTALPIMLITGALAHYRPGFMLGSFVMVALFSVALSAIALCGSMRAPDVRRANILMLLIAVALLPALRQSVHVGSHETVVSAWTALSPALGIGMWQQGVALRVSLFGLAVPSLLVSVVLALVVIAWCLAALVRSIKSEPDQRSLFSPVQVVGLSASVLLFVYAAFRPIGETVNAFHSADLSQLRLEMLIGTGVSAAIACLYFTVNSTLLTRDNLRQELRKRPPLEVAARTVAPWIATGLLTLLAAVLALNGYRRLLDDASPLWFDVIAMYLSIIAYALRDGLFLQWMVSHKIKAPVVKGTALLVCYYAASSVMAAVMAGPEHMREMLRWLAPYIMTPEHSGPGWMIVPMLIPPLATAGLVAFGIFRKMQRAKQGATVLVGV